MKAKVYTLPYITSNLEVDSFDCPTLEIMELEDFEDTFKGRIKEAPIDFNIEVEGKEGVISFTLRREDAKFLAKSILNILER